MIVTLIIFRKEGQGEHGEDKQARDEEHDKSLIELVRQAQNGDTSAIEQLLLHFQPLLRKYSRRLGYEDANHELVEWFISSVKKYPLNKNE